MQLNMCMLCRLIRLRCSCLREAKQWYLLCAAQKQAAQQHAGVPLWCSKAPGSRRALLQQPSGVGPPQNAVVDMTQSPLEATMMAPPSDSGQAHIESGDGTAVTYVPDTPARRLQAAQNPPTVVDMTNSAIEAHHDGAAKQQWPGPHRGRRRHCYYIRAGHPCSPPAGSAGRSGTLGAAHRGRHEPFRVGSNHDGWAARQAAVARSAPLSRGMAPP